jgi:two-component system sensor histidine kinase BaeS
LKKTNGSIEVLWDDSSPGVPEADLPRLSERLFRVDGSRSRGNGGRNGGSGLGLAIAHAIVAAHGGSLAASASPLGGLRVRLTFPAAPR